jgi:hypothetical protein
MSENRRRKSRAPTVEELHERFSTGGQDFLSALRRVIAGGRDGHTGHTHNETTDERKADT